MILALAAMLACSTDKDAASDFEGGNFQFTTTEVNDGCLDGAFTSVLMPEGTAEDWSNPVELPGVADLPSTYDITIQDPYGTLSVTVEAGSSTDQMSVSGAVATGVEFDADTYPGCLVDNSIDVALTIVDADNLQGTATLHTDSFDEASCPAVTTSPCDVVLDLTAARI